MIEFILKNGKKWSEIGKVLENHRTEHMIKNRFKTLNLKLNKKYSGNYTEKELLLKFLGELSIDVKEGQL